MQLENAFTEVDITSLQAMADQLAMAVENARLRVELEKAQRELAAQLQR
jgi:GAF domain-containing protein